MSEVNFENISEFNTPEESPGFLLWQVSLNWRKKIEASLRPLGITHPQFVVLASLGWLVSHNKKVTQKELSNQTFIDPATISQIIRGLDKKGLIKRNIGDDERSKFPALTKAGADIIASALPAVENADREFFSFIKNQKDFIKYLKSLRM